MIEELFINGGFERFRDEVLEQHDKGMNAEEITRWYIKNHYVFDDRIFEHVVNILNNKPVVDIFTSDVYNI